MMVKRYSPIWCVAMLCLASQSAPAINIQIDYTYDLPANGGANFFGSGNPQGVVGGTQAKAALEAAANFYSVILTDSFSAIQRPLDYHSNQFDGAATWQWTMNFNNPTTNVPVVINSPTVAADQYIIYVGAHTLSGSEAGQAGPGGYTWAYNPSGQFTVPESNELAAIQANFVSAVERRGQPNGFGRWGGTITFDNDGTTPWFFNHLSQPSGNVADFYSVALHELGHALGIGDQSTPPQPPTDWQQHISGTSFVGATAISKNKGNQVPLSPDLGHWAAGTMSVVYGTVTPQETLMDPDLQNGTRKKLTELDAAGLQDMGWLLGPAPPSAVNGDYNGNGIVDAGDYAIWRKRLNQNVTLPNDTTPGTVTAADYTVWRGNFGKTSSGSGSGSLLAGREVPEPDSRLLAATLALCVCGNRRALRRYLVPLAASVS